MRRMVMREEEEDGDGGHMMAGWVYGFPAPGSAS